MTDNSNTQTRHLITRDDPCIRSCMESLSRIDRNLDHLGNSAKPGILNDPYISEKELAELLKITRRQLFKYRREGILPYFTLGSRVLYKTSDIEKFMADNYLPAIPR